jgi:hypothetical protein
MPTGFLSLPGEIRNEIYKYLVVQSEPILFDNELQAWTGPRELEINGNILYANKTIYHEASSLLYSLNTFYFYFVEETNEYEETFDFIGHKNASYIQNLCILLPSTDEVKSGGATMQGVILMLNLIERVCTSLKTIQFGLENMKKAGDIPGCPEDIAEAFALIATRLRAFQSPKKIIVVANYPDIVNKGIKREMNKHGWARVDGPTYSFLRMHYYSPRFV